MPAQYRALWNTPGGGTGYSVIHALNCTTAEEAQTFSTATSQFFTDLEDLFPDEVQVGYDSEVIVMTSAGLLIDVFPVTPASPMTGTQVSVYNRAAGVRIDWGTDEIVAGRRLTGRTYLVPAAAGAYDSNGLVNSSTITAVTSAANTYRLALGDLGGLCVWSRTHEQTAPVTNVSVPAKGAILRGRRD